MRWLDGITDSMDMSLNKFWVNDTTTQLLFLKKPLCYDASADTLGPASKNDAPYRVSLVYFYKDDLSW